LVKVRRHISFSLLLAKSATRGAQDAVGAETVREAMGALGTGCIGDEALWIPLLHSGTLLAV